MIQKPCRRHPDEAPSSPSRSSILCLIAFGLSLLITGCGSAITDIEKIEARDGRISAETQLGAFYTLQFATNLLSNTVADVWTDVPSQVGIPGTGGVHVFQDPQDSELRFYRLVLSAEAPTTASNLLKVVNLTLAPSATDDLRVNLTSSGDLFGLGFDLEFDPAVVTLVSASGTVDGVIYDIDPDLGAGMARVAANVSPGSPMGFPAGTLGVAEFRFMAAEDAALGESVVRITRAEFSDAAAQSLPGSSMDGKVTLSTSPPTPPPPRPRT